MTRVDVDLAESPAQAGDLESSATVRQPAPLTVDPGAISLFVQALARILVARAFREEIPQIASAGE